MQTYYEVPLAHDLYPEGTKIVGVVYWDHRADQMSEDMLEVQLPNGVNIFAGYEAGRGYVTEVTIGQTFSIKDSEYFSTPEQVVECIEDIIESVLEDEAWIALIPHVISLEDQLDRTGKEASRYRWCKANIMLPGFLWRNHYTDDTEADPDAVIDYLIEEEWKRGGKLY